MVHWLTAILAAVLTAGFAWRLGALSWDGMVAAAIVGSLVFGIAGLEAALILVFFFASSSALSAVPGGADREARGSGQVLANGGVATLGVLVHPLHPVGDLVFLGALAAATADTWATEVGLRFGGVPRSILDWRRVARGSSGGITALGVAAQIAGAAAVALVGGWLLGPTAIIAPVAVGGLVGSIADSVIGASIQARYRCPACGTPLEVPWHASCSSRGERVSGWPGLHNDHVNGLATLAGALTTAGLFLL